MTERVFVGYRDCEMYGREGDGGESPGVLLTQLGSKDGDHIEHSADDKIHARLGVGTEAWQNDRAGLCRVSRRNEERLLRGFCQSVPAYEQEALSLMKGGV